MKKQKQRDVAWKAYEAIHAPAWKDYEAIKVLALEAYEAIQVPARETYEAELERIDNEPHEDIIEVDGKRYQLIN